ncbi:hypothetical protein [Inquilinus sp. CAU 1745]|uniref:hypothetical protein n=1 Tax=Inquilinus sp. CAU 1745 TaxID=3140369 RepID=UPI00325A62D3
MLEPITNRVALAGAIRDLQEKFSGAPDAARVGRRTRWNLLDRGIWADFWINKRDQKYWTEFGVGRGGDDDDRIVQINAPLVGSNPNLTGLIAKEGGERWLCHWGFLKAKPKSITNTMFDEVFDLDRERETVWFNGEKSRDFYRVACLDAPEFLDDLDDFVRACWRVREYWNERETGRRPRATKHSLFDRKLPRRYCVPPRDPLEVNSRHDAVVTALADQLYAMGCDPSDKRMLRRGPDLFFGSEESTVALFEIKTTVSPYSIYTAIGQLFFYSKLLNAPKMTVIVLPDYPSDTDTQVLRTLEIKVLRYDDDGNRVEFLDDVAELLDLIGRDR